RDVRLPWPPDGRPHREPGLSEGARRCEGWRGGRISAEPRADAAEIPRRDPIQVRREGRRHAPNVPARATRDGHDRKGLARPPVRPRAVRWSPIPTMPELLAQRPKMRDICTGGKGGVWQTVPAARLACHYSA